MQKIINKLRERKDIIEVILEDFGVDSAERIEDILEEREDILVTLKTLSKYKEKEPKLGKCPLCGENQVRLFQPYCSADCQIIDQTC